MRVKRDELIGTKFQSSLEYDTATQ